MKANVTIFWLGVFAKFWGVDASNTPTMPEIDRGLEGTLVRVYHCQWDKRQRDNDNQK